MRSAKELMDIFDELRKERTEAGEYAAASAWKSAESTINTHMHGKPNQIWAREAIASLKRKIEAEDDQARKDVWVEAIAIISTQAL